MSESAAFAKIRGRLNAMPEEKLDHILGMLQAFAFTAADLSSEDAARKANASGAEPDFGIASYGGGNTPSR